MQIRHLGHILALALAAASAAAEDGAYWTKTGNWDVQLEPRMDNGCYATVSWNSGTGIRVGRNPVHDNFYVMISNENWSSLRDGHDYTLQIQFDSHPVWDVSATGYQFEPGEPVFLFAQSNKMNFIREFQRALVMEISYDNGNQDRLKLNGSRRAWDEVEACHRASANWFAPHDMRPGPAVTPPGEVSSGSPAAGGSSGSAGKTKNSGGKGKKKN
ncbi:hypothetical protein [Pseudoruegeria sp. HB172150]|uniref:hypothetical protein n=1 Tax=Pseudoruegeria sp. HB172150 TaxID=2721164 RepID=UPI0015550AA7|nr:hypothetical protein [Pseudoruegeria sp. HB172150]